MMLCCGYQCELECDVQMLAGVSRYRCDEGKRYAMLDRNANRMREKSRYVDGWMGEKMVVGLVGG